MPQAGMYRKGAVGAIARAVALVLIGVAVASCSNGGDGGSGASEPVNEATEPAPNEATEPAPDTADPEVVGRSFIDAWAAADTDGMEALADPSQWAQIATQTEQFRPRGSATGCFAFTDGSQYQCDATGTGGEDLYVLMNPDGNGGWWIGWAAQSTGD